MIAYYFEVVDLEGGVPAHGDDEDDVEYCEGGDADDVVPGAHAEEYDLPLGQERQHLEHQEYEDGGDDVGDVVGGLVLEFSIELSLKWVDGLGRVLLVL